MNTEKQIVIKLKGGMGNQMFQYAFGKTLAKTAEKAGVSVDLLFDVTAYTDPIKKDTKRPYMLDLLNTDAKIADDATALNARNPYGLISKVIRKINQKLRTDDFVAFKADLLESPYKSYYEGYWQTEKYFLPIIERIRQEFTLREPLGKVAQSIYEKINSDPNAVAIFYRRTDYVGHKTFDISGQGYEERAMAHMSTQVPNMRLYVMSDDIDWVKANVTLPEGSVYVSSSKAQPVIEIPPHEEMKLASTCKHNIIPNSTFAWWGAWLNPNPNKIIIAPKDWVQGDASEYQDITPSGWLRL